MNALKKRKGVVGSSALNLINSWKQMVNEVSKPKPKIVVEPCHSSSEDEASEDEGDEDEDEDEEVAEAISHSRLDEKANRLYTHCIVYTIKFQQW